MFWSTDRMQHKRKAHNCHCQGTGPVLRLSGGLVTALATARSRWKASSAVSHSASCSASISAVLVESFQGSVTIKCIHFFTVMNISMFSFMCMDVCINSTSKLKQVSTHLILICYGSKWLKYGGTGFHSLLVLLLYNHDDLPV